jgi:polysaccharide transporter, PST family
VFFMFGLWIVRREVPFASFSIKGARATLNAGRHVFTLAVVGTVATNANALLLGMVAAPAVVGIFSGAEKIAKIIVVAFAPFRQIFFPVVAADVADNPRSAWLLVRRLMVVSSVFSAIGAVAILAFAESIVEIVLGPAFLPSVPVLRIMAVMPILLILTECLATFWLLPNRRDRVTTHITMITGAIHVLLFMGLSMGFGVIGSAAAVVVSQLLTFLLVWLAARSIPRSSGPLLPTASSGK